MSWDGGPVSVFNSSLTIIRAGEWLNSEPLAIAEISKHRKFLEAKKVLLQKRKTSHRR